MTREFKKQRRDDARPPFRPSSSAYPPRGRSRYNDDGTDGFREKRRAYTQGDDRPRNTYGHPPRPRWHEQNQQGERSSFHSSTNQRANHERHERPHQPRFERPTNNGSRPFNSERRGYDERPFNDNRRGHDERGFGADRRSHNERPFDTNRRGHNERPFERPRGFNGNRSGAPEGRFERGRNNFAERHNEQHSPTHTGPRSRDFDHDRGPRENQGRDAGRWRAFSEGSGPRRGPTGRGPSSNRGEQENTYGRRGVRRNEPPPREFQRNRYEKRPNFQNRRDPEEEQRAPHPRAQSRPEAFYRQQAAEEKRAARRYEEQFEGDYEQFEYEAPQHKRHDRAERFSDREELAPAEERHVTKLPDGRVLKGPRPVQRRNAQFWTEISEDTENLIHHIHTPNPDAEDGTEDEMAEEESGESSGQEGAETNASLKKPRKATSGVKQGGKAAAKKPRSHGPKPSRRGFKWPAP